MKIDIDMGRTGPQGAGEPALLDLEELLATRLLVQGNSGSGKSHLLRRLLEQSASHVQQVVIDPEGDFLSLSERFGHVVIDADRGAAEIETIAARVRQHRVSAILSLENLDAEGQMRAAALFLNALFDAERDHWFPLLVVVDEAQLFAPAVSGDVPEDARRASLGAMTNLMCRGRKRGLAGVIATQRLAKLAKNVAAEATNFLMGRTFLDIDMARAADLLGLERRQAEMFRELPRGQFVALGPALSRRPLPIRVGSIETQPRAAPARLTPLPDQTDDTTRDLILAPIPAEAPRVRTDHKPVRAALPSMTEMLAQIVREGAEAAPMVDESGPALSDAERRAAHLSIIGEILREPDAAFRPEALLFQDFGVRCRIARVGPIPALPVFRLLLNAGRAGVDHAELSEAWAGALETAQGVPDDLQAVFLILAGAALRRLPCPSDAEIATRCGQHAPGRARSRIGHLEKSGFVVMRPGPSGQRAAVLPDLGWETAWGDATAPADLASRRLVAG